MKIRIRGNSIRYRLTKSEVETFSRTGSYGNETKFNNNTLSYILNAKEGIKNLEADFTDNTITIFFPKKEVANWADSTTVGFSHSFVLDSGITLELLVEKDFVCMDETIEDQSDNYPNPKAINQS
ncbi:MAG: hypothetical protein WBB27_06230 [Maribacter sp.]